MCGDHMKLKERIDALEKTVANLQQECRRLYSQGFSNGVEVARKEYADELKRLEDTGLITCHGFLRNEEVDKLTETLYNQLGIHTDKLEPISATKMANEAWFKWADPIFSEHYEQVDKTVKCEKECTEPECKDSCEYLLMFHNAFDNSTVYKCTKLGKRVSIPDSSFKGLSPADFNKE